MKIDKDWVLIVILCCIIGFLGLKIYKLERLNHMQVESLEQHFIEDGRYTAIYNDQTIASLKQTNKELYDSLKIYKDKLDYYIKFKYSKDYDLDTVFISKPNESDSVNVYAYANKNDSIEYNLQIGSTKEPNWYKLDFRTTNEFTIVSKNDNGLNQTTIESNQSGDISDVTILKNDRKTFLDNFAIGPSINAGYDIVNRNFGINVGISIVYKIPLKKKNKLNIEDNKK